MPEWTFNYYDAGDIPAWQHIPTAVAADDAALQRLVEHQRQTVTMNMSTSMLISVAMALTGASIAHKTPGERRLAMFVFAPLSVALGVHAAALALVRNAPPNMCRRVALPWFDLVACGPVVSREHHRDWYEVMHDARYELRRRL
jgi:hypothetical protein